MKNLILAMVVILLFAQSASAHHFWVEKEADGFNISWGALSERDRMQRIGFYKG